MRTTSWIFRRLVLPAGLLVALFLSACIAPGSREQADTPPLPPSVIVAHTLVPQAADLKATSTPTSEPTATPAPSTSSPSLAEVPRASRVLVISLDGARPDAILQVSSPNIQGLAARGAVDWSAQTVFPPATLPAHASMLTGLDVSAHGIDFNDSQSFRPVLEAPTFLTLAHQAGYRTAMVVGKEKLKLLQQPGDVDDYTFVRNGDTGVADRTIELLASGFEVIFAHFPNPDYFGHSTDWMSETYLNQMVSTDVQVGRVLTALQELGLADTTLVILTADHGGHDAAHGANMPEDMTIPWIVAGPGIVPGTRFESGSVSVMDTAATVLWALGIPAPPSVKGRPAQAAFNP